MEAVWTRIERGDHVAVLGDASPAISFPDGARCKIVRVRCDRPGGSLGPLFEARRRVLESLGQADEDSEDQRGLRRTLLDERGGAGARLGTTQFAEAFNAFEQASSGACALVFERVEAADETTLAVLADLLARPYLLRLPVVLGFGTPVPTGAAALLVEALFEAEGEGSIIHVEGAAPTALPSLPELRPEVRLVLRAGAVIGATFETDLVAGLLDIPSLSVLELLQEACDAGVSLIDAGDGVVAFPNGAREQMIDNILPSLARAWHARLGALLRRGGRDELEGAVDLRGAAPEPAGPVPEGHAARAAAHFESAGDSDKAIESYLTTARELLSFGQPDEALRYCTSARKMLAELPSNAARRRLDAELLVEQARIQLKATADEGDYTLQGALQTIEAALTLLQPSDPADLQARALCTLAAVAYDMGDPSALERSLEALTEAARLLAGAGDATGATRLLNDQAAVWVRLGDPVRAAHLLRESRAVFEGRAHGGDPTAMIELAETEHLLARLPLHVDAREGMHDEAVRRAIEHAREAETLYARLSAERELARVWETLGRLLLLAGESDDAHEHLMRALDTQQAVGDALGLARTAGALSDLLVASGRIADAIALLEGSVQLNREKGSPLGLAYNREALGLLAGTLDRDQRSEFGDQLGVLEETIAAAAKNMLRG